MNIEKTIERIHAANAERRRAEHKHSPRRLVWRIAVPTATAAAVLLAMLMPHGNKAQASTPTPGIYCNSQCNPDDVMTLIDNNINHIRSIRSL